MADSSGRRTFWLDRPGLVTAVLLALVLAHWLLDRSVDLGIGPDRLVADLDDSIVGQLVSAVALGVAGVAAMVGGFAGVVVVFGLSSDDSRFRQVRLRSATSLRQNWTSVVTTPLVAAFGSLIAAGLSLQPTLASGAMWILEVCVVLAAHGAVRLVVVLRELVKVVAAADKSWMESQANSDDRGMLDL